MVSVSFAFCMDWRFAGLIGWLVEWIWIPLLLLLLLLFFLVMVFLDDTPHVKWRSLLTHSTFEWCSLLTHCTYWWRSLLTRILHKKKPTTATTKEGDQMHPNKQWQPNMQSNPCIRLGHAKHCTQNCGFKRIVGRPIKAQENLNTIPLSLLGNNRQHETP